MPLSECCSVGLRVRGLIALAAAGVLATALVPRIGQDPEYHSFADRRTVLGAPNLMDVLSNAAFVVVGATGIGFVARRARHWEPALRLTWGAAFAGVFLTGFGSAWYHLDPRDATLVWDRVPMAISFAGIVAGVIAERISLRAGAWLVGPLLLVAVGSVIHWWITESNGAGDLRPYGFVQGFTLLAVLYVALLFPARRISTRALLIALGWYALAKVFEVLDGPIYRVGIGELRISGHTFKHLAAAMGTWWVLRDMKRT